MVLAGRTLWLPDRLQSELPLPRWLQANQRHVAQLGLQAPLKLHLSLMVIGLYARASATPGVVSTPWMPIVPLALALAAAIAIEDEALAWSTLGLLAGHSLSGSS